MGKIKEIWCMHHSHLDIGYTHPQPMLLELQGDYIEQAIEFCEKTRDYPKEAQMKWTCEAAYPVVKWMERASRQMVERFIRLVGENRISITALPMHTTPGCTGMQMLDMMKNLDWLREKLATPVSTAINHDVNGQPWPLSQLLIDSQVDFYLTGINIHFGGIPFKRPCAFWWEAPDGRRILSFVGEHYSLFSQFCQTHEADTGKMHQGICDYVKRLEEGGYQWDFAFLTATNPPMYDNNCPDAGLADLIRRYNEEGHEYKVRFATPEMLRDKLLSYESSADGGAFPVYAGDWTDYWNFGSASTARETKVSRLAARALESVDMLECMTGFGDKRYQEAKQEAKLNALIYGEHTWGASQSISWPQDYESISQEMQKKVTAYRAADLAGYVLGTQMEKLAGNPHQTDGMEGILAVNPTGNTMEVRLDIPEGWMKKERQLSEIRKKRCIPYLDGAKVKACYAEESAECRGKVTVPPFSARALTFDEIKEMKTQQEGRQWIRKEGETVETPFYRITLGENGCGIRQIYDKKLERNLLHGEAGWNFFELVRETVDEGNRKEGRKAIFSRDVDEGNRNISGWNHHWKAKRAGSRENSVWNVEVGEENIIFRGNLLVEGASLAEQTITFYKDQEEIDLGLRINKDAVWEPEGIYLVFPFALKEGWECVFNTAGQFVKLDEQQLGKTCRDYVTVENGIALYDGEICCSLACPHAPMVQIGDFNFGRENEVIMRKKDPILAAWPMNNYWETNFAPCQRDIAEFHYQLKVSRRADLWQLQGDFVRAENRGLIGAVARMEELLAAGFKKELDADTGKEEPGIVKSLIKCSKEGAVTNLYPAKAGGMIAVLKNHGADCQTVTVRVPGKDQIRVYETDVQEKAKGQIPVKDGVVELTLMAYEWKFLHITEQSKTENQIS